ncbi:MAG: hypothetical protein ACT4ON_09405 [Bacteroidota bacterium]
MELKDFIKHTLLDIVNGVEEANSAKKRFHLSSNFHSGTGENGQNVEFDVSLIINESSENNAKGGIKVALVNLAGEAKESESNQNIHKIKFQVFVSEKERSK